MKKVLTKNRIKILLPLLLVAASMVIASCSQDDASSSDAYDSANFSAVHEASPDMQQRVLDDVQSDLQSIAQVSTNPDDLANSLTGKMLDDQKALLSQDLAQNRYRKRDYQNIVLKFSGYSSPFAELQMEFDDFGYYVDATTGQQLSQPTGEHKIYDAAASEDGGTWKIVGLYAPSSSDTPLDAPDAGQ